MLVVWKWLYQKLVYNILLNKLILQEDSMSKKTLAHVVWDCKYHIVLVPKYRYKFFTKEVREALRDEIKKLCVWMNIGIIKGNVGKDHVHLCLTIPPKHSVAEIIGTLKGKAAIRMFNRFPELKKRYWGCHFWSRGYYASTVGIDENVIVEYIKNQDKLDRYETQGKLFK